MLMEKLKKKLIGYDLLTVHDMMKNRIWKHFNVVVIFTIALVRI